MPLLASVLKVPMKTIALPPLEIAVLVESISANVNKVVTITATISCFITFPIEILSG